MRRKTGFYLEQDDALRYERQHHKTLIVTRKGIHEKVSYIDKVSTPGSEFVYTPIIVAPQIDIMMDECRNTNTNFN